MDEKSRGLIVESINEINSIQKELEDIARELGSFQGIGIEYCAQSLLQNSKEYQKIITQLRNIK